MSNHTISMDRFLHELLVEEARGGADEDFIAAVERAIDGQEVIAGSRESEERRTAVPLAWAALLIVSLVGVFWFLPREDPGTAQVAPGEVEGAAALVEEKVQAMRLRIEDVNSKEDQVPIRISFTYLLDGREKTEVFEAGKNWPELDSPEGTSFPFHAERISRQQVAIGVYLERLADYLTERGAEFAEVRKALLIETNYEENEKLARPSLPTDPADTAVVIREAKDLTAYEDGLSLATLLRVYLPKEVNTVPSGGDPEGAPSYPLFATLVPEKRFGIHERVISPSEPVVSLPWSTARATMVGIDPNIYYEDVPPVTVNLVDLHPSSTTYMRVYPGTATDNPTDAVKVRSSYVIINDFSPQKRRLILKDLDQYFAKEGYHTIEIVQESPLGTHLLCRSQIRVDRTIEVRGGIYTDEQEYGPHTPVGGLTVSPRSAGWRVEYSSMERYGRLRDSRWQSPWKAPLSTFSADIDTASYNNLRRMLKDGTRIPKDAVRLEECVNYFDYGYAAPTKGGPFAVHLEMANCPWAEGHQLVKVGIKGREVTAQARPPSNLVFLIDVSGSMDSPDKLPLLVESMKVLVGELDERDSVGIVVYAGTAGTVLEPTVVAGEGRAAIIAALDRLKAGGSTAGAAGIQMAYDLTARNFREGGVNRVILASDGDFNVGTSSEAELVDLVVKKAKGGTYLTVLGFGTGNLNDSMMEAITNEGNGNYFYLDSQREGRKVFLQNLTGTLVTIAKDVKIQVEFNPGKVQSYRLLGYANRRLQDEDFDNDKVDAGDIGAGHTVTALYEVVPLSADAPRGAVVKELKYQPAHQKAVNSPEWMTVKLRYKAPAGEKSELLEVPLEADPLRWEKASPDFRFASAVALFAEKLRGEEPTASVTWHQIGELALQGGSHDRHGHRAEFLELLGLAAKLHPDAKEKEEDIPDPVTGQSGAVEAAPAGE